MIVCTTRTTGTTSSTTISKNDTSYQEHTYYVSNYKVDPIEVVEIDDWRISMIIERMVWHRHQTRLLKPIKNKSKLQPGKTKRLWHKQN